MGRVLLLLMGCLTLFVWLLHAGLALTFPFQLEYGEGAVLAFSTLLARGEPYASCLARGRAVRIAVNQTMSDESALLDAGAEVAFFPPVTGG